MNQKFKLIYLVYLWLVLFGVLPLLLVFTTSFLSHNFQHLISLPFTFVHYQNLFDPLMVKIFLRSLYIGSITTIICLLIAYPFSYFMIKSPHQSILLLLIIIPFWTSSLVRTYALLAIFKLHGLLNTLLQTLEWVHKPHSWLYANSTVIIGLVYTLFPFMVLPLYTQMERFDYRLIDAAKDLGASRFTIFFRVFLPNTTQGIVSGCLLVFLPAITLFYIPNILGGARSMLVGNLIQNQFFVAENWPSGAATSILLTVFLLVIFGLFKRKNRMVE